MRRRAVALDALLEAHIHEAPRTIRDLRLFVETRSTEAVPRIERALQRLRRQKRVQLLGRLWAPLFVVPCAECAGQGWSLGVATAGTICVKCDGAGWVRSETVEDPADADESK